MRGLGWGLDSRGSGDCRAPFLRVLKGKISLWVFLCVLAADEGHSSEAMVKSQTFLSAEVFSKVWGDRFLGKMK